METRPVLVNDKRSASLAAAGDAQPFTGREINFAPFDGYLEVGVDGGAGLTYDVVIGGQSVARGVPVAGNAAYVAPSALEVLNIPVRAGTPIIVSVSNPTAGALTYYASARLSALPRNTS